jgi:hypothetical protein
MSVACSHPPSLVPLRLGDLLADVNADILDLPDLLTPLLDAERVEFFHRLLGEPACRQLGSSRSRKGSNCRS